MLVTCRSSKPRVIGLFPPLCTNRVPCRAADGTQQDNTQAHVAAREQIIPTQAGLGHHLMFSPLKPWVGSGIWPGSSDAGQDAHFPPQSGCIPLPVPVPGPNSPLRHTLGGTGDGSSDWASASFRGHLEPAPGSWLQAGTVPTFVGI